MIRAFFLLAAAVPLGAQNWDVFAGQPEAEDAGRAVSRYLSRAYAEAGREFRAQFEKLESAADVEAYQSAARARIRTWLGEMPERTPLRPRVTGVLRREGYRVEKTIFESRPGNYVTANLYVPAETGRRFPAVLCPLGHWREGKAFPSYQSLAVYLVRRGFVVLTYDLPGMGERLQYYDSVYGRSLAAVNRSENEPVMEHSLLNGPALLAGRSLAYYLLWDGFRALDYLAGRPEVDADRIACTGASGGGLQTELLAALDARIKVAIPVVYGGCVADSLFLPGFGDRDTQPLIAPRPLLLIVATGDSETKRSLQYRGYEQAARIYGLLGASDRIRFTAVESKHDYSRPMQEIAEGWLRKWFNMPAAGDPPALDAPETEASLAATVSGQVRVSLGGETVASLSSADARRRAQPTPPPSNRSGWAGWRERLRGRVAERLGFDEHRPALGARVVSATGFSTYRVEKIIYSSQPEIPIPGLLFLPLGRGPFPAVIFTNEDGKTAGEVVERYLLRFVEAGYAAFAIDVSGTGETSPGPTPPSYRYYFDGPEAELHFRALRAGRSLAGMRVHDIARGLDYLQTRQELDGRRISGFGLGAGGVQMLYAGALDGRLSAVVAAGALVSYAELAGSEFYTQRLGVFVPSARLYFDLPEVAALAAPRPVTLLNLADGRNRRLELERAAEAYRPAADVYRLLGAERALRVLHADSPGAIAEACLETFGRAAR